jgi:hypothetical protein
MKDKGLIRETIHCYATAIRLMPRFAAAHSNLGSVLKEQVRAHLKEGLCTCNPFKRMYLLLQFRMREEQASVYTLSKACC